MSEGGVSESGVAAQGEVAAVEDLIRAVRAGVDALPSDLVTPHFFVRLASGRVETGKDALDLFAGNRSWLGDDAGVGGRMIENCGSGFLLRAAPSTDPRLPSSAWLFYIRDRRVSAAVHFDDVESARRALPPYVRNPSPCDVIEMAIDAFDRADIAALLPLVSTDFRFSLPPGSSYVGIGALVKLLTSIHAEYDEYVVVDYELVDLGDGFVLLDGLVRTRIGSRITTSPRSILCRVQDGRATEWVLHDSPASAREELAERLSEAG